MKKLVILIAVLLLASMLWGCGPQTPEIVSPYQPEDPPVYTAAEKLDPRAVALPLAEPVTLTAWWPTGVPEFKDPGENLAMKEAMKRTGIRFEFVVPEYGNEQESIAIIISMGRFPALLKDFSRYYVRGLDAAQNDGIIIPLEGYLDYMPDIDRWRTSTETIRRALTSDTGHFYGIPLLILNKDTTVRGGLVNGYALRADWLDALGLPVPETYDELDTLLGAMQRKTPHPMGLAPNADSYGLMSGFQIVSPQAWIVKDGRVLPPLLEENFRDYIALLADWVRKGYIAEDYYVKATDADLLKSTARGELGVFPFSTRSYESYMAAAEDPSFAPAPIPPLRRSKTDTIHVRTSYSGAQIAACVSVECEHPEYPCAFFNYFFTEEGILLGNYGIEGDTFTWGDDGEPHYTQRYREDYARYGRDRTRTMYFTCMGPGINWWNSDTEENDYNIPFARVWDADDITDYAWSMPLDTTINQEERTAYNKALFDYTIYVPEQLTRFITGDRPMSEWDAFINQVERMGIRDAQEIMQRAYDRYMDR